MSTTNPYPVTSMITETRVPLSPSDTQCDWCCEMATSKIIDECALQGFQYACTVHGTEWYPHLFPESDVTPIESIIAEINSRVSLVKELPGATEVMIHFAANPSESRLAKRRSNARTLRPWYPLVGHRDGLRRNDLVTLGSALFVLALEGGTQYLADVSPALVNQD